MGTPAMILLHAPSVVDFRKLPILRGPVSDLVPSSSVFEMYPLGFTSIAAYLEDHDFPVQIINLAARMLKDETFDLERFVQTLPEPMVYGIDLHWLPHAQGSLALAAMIKAHHPNVPILFGGFSSTYFHEELITYPQVDLVIRGDSTEGAVLKLMQTLVAGNPLDEVPNLTWVDKHGTIHVNPLGYHPSILDEVDLDFRRVMVAAVRDRDLLNYLPFLGWLKYPIMPAASCRGCIMNCVGCGGSSYAFKKLHHRFAPVYRTPERLAQDIHHIASVSNGPIFILGDMRQSGKAYAQKLLDGIRGIDIPVIIELFWPASESFMQDVAKAIPHFAIEISIESHDPVVRQAYGKPYTNEQVHQTIANALNAGTQRLDLFFMTGLPQQTYQSVLDSASFAEMLLAKYGSDQRLRPFIGPMAPFVDPGSLAFEEPDKHGYKIFYRTLEEHRQALLEPSWQFTLNYETQWMTRREIVGSTYEACLRFSDLKVKYGLIDATHGAQVQHILTQGWRLAQEIEANLKAGKFEAMLGLKEQIDEVNRMQGVGEHKEMQLAGTRHSFKWVWLIGLLIEEWFRHQGHKVRRRWHRPARTKPATTTP